MSFRPTSQLNPKKRYLQVALNNSLTEAHAIIRQLPISDRILVEVGTPLIKRYGEEGIRRIRQWYEEHMRGGLSESLSSTLPTMEMNLPPLLQSFIERAKEKAEKKAAELQQNTPSSEQSFEPYIVADLKTMDRGSAEVEIAARAGARAAVALGAAPTETLNSFIEQCEQLGLDAMIDMMNVEYPLAVLRALKKVPPVIILHRGVDEEQLNREKQIPLHEIRRIKGNYNVMISIAGGDTLKEIQRSVFNDADIVVVWKSVFQNTNETAELVKGFLKAMK